MPIYEYKCNQCEKRFELRRGIKDCDAEIKCPACGAPAPERVFSVFATASSGGSCAPASPT